MVMVVSIALFTVWITYVPPQRPNALLLRMRKFFASSFSSNSSSGHPCAVVDEVSAIEAGHVGSCKYERIHLVIMRQSRLTCDCGCLKYSLQVLAPKVSSNASMMKLHHRHQAKALDFLLANRIILETSFVELQPMLT